MRDPHQCCYPQSPFLPTLLLDPFEGRTINILQIQALGYCPQPLWPATSRSFPKDASIVMEISRNLDVFISGECKMYSSIMLLTYVSGIFSVTPLIISSSKPLSFALQRGVLTQSHPDVSHDVITIGYHGQNCRSPTKLRLNLSLDVQPPSSEYSRIRGLLEHLSQRI